MSDHACVSFDLSETYSVGFSFRKSKNSKDKTKYHDPQKPIQYQKAD